MGSMGSRGQKRLLMFASMIFDLCAPRAFKNRRGNRNPIVSEFIGKCYVHNFAISRKCDFLQKLSFGVGQTHENESAQVVGSDELASDVSCWKGLSKNHQNLEGGQTYYFLKVRFRGT